MYIHICMHSVHAQLNNVITCLQLFMRSYLWQIDATLVPEAMPLQKDPGPVCRISTDTNQTHRKKKKHTQYDLHPSSPVLWQNAFCNVKAGTDPLVAELFVSFSTVQGASCRKTEREWSSDRRGMCTLTRRPMPCSADIKIWTLKVVLPLSL